MCQICSFYHKSHNSPKILHQSAGLESQFFTKSNERFQNYCLFAKKSHQKHLTSMYAINQIPFSCDWLRPVSNDVLLPCRTKLIELNSTLARQYSATFESKSCYCRIDRVARQALPCYTAVARLLPCRTQLIN